MLALVQQGAVHAEGAGEDDGNPEHAGGRRFTDAAVAAMAAVVETLGALTSNHAARLAAVRDRLPPSVVLMLLLSAVLSTALLGRQQGISKEWCLGTTIAFTALVCMVVWVTLDLNQPQSGWITVSQQPLEDLLHNLEKERPLEASLEILP